MTKNMKEIDKEKYSILLYYPEDFHIQIIPSEKIHKILTRTIFLISIGVLLYTLFFNFF